jgi:guanylate kinase
LIVVLSGPGGVGKGTLVERFVQRNPQFRLSRSWTTRARRPGEPEDAYVFVTAAEFQARIDAGGFLEWAPFLDYHQGTPALDADAGGDVLLEIDTQGARQVKELHPDALLIFVDAPSRDEQRRRLEGRGDAPDRIQERLDLAVTELERAEALGMHRVVNDDLERAVQEVEALVRAAAEN